MWVSFFLGIIGQWSMSMEGAEVGNRVQMVVDMTETALLEMTSVGQLNFITEYIEYTGLKSLGQIQICIKQYVSNIKLWLWQQGPVAKFLVQVLVTIWAAGEVPLQGAMPRVMLEIKIRHSGLDTTSK